MVLLLLFSCCCRRLLLLPFLPPSPTHIHTHTHTHTDIKITHTHTHPPPYSSPYSSWPTQSNHARRNHGGRQSHAPLFYTHRHTDTQTHTHTHTNPYLLIPPHIRHGRPKVIMTRKIMVVVNPMHRMQGMRIASGDIRRSEDKIGVMLHKRLFFVPQVLFPAEEDVCLFIWKNGCVCGWVCE
jgi:hypothetical protein